MLAVIAGAAAAFALGLLDDFRHIAPATKLVGQVLIAAMLVVGGIEVRIIEFPPLSFLVTVFWIVGMMNAVNLLDNMDGLAAGIAAIAAAFLGITAFANPEAGVLPGTALLASVTAGASIGFLFHNFAPARVFMGDAGSLVLGYLLAVIALFHTASGAANLTLALVAPLAILALPLFDTIFVATSRRIAGIPISKGGRDHTSHRLAALGLSDRSAVVALYAIAAAFAVLGVAADAISAFVVPLAALGTVGLVLFGIFLHEVDVYGSRRTARPNALTSALRIYGRFGAEVGLDVVLLTSAYYLAYVVRFEGLPIGIWMRRFVESVPLVVGIQLGALVGLGVYRTLWRYLGISDTVAIVRAIAIGTGLAVLAILVVFRFQDYSRAVFLLDVLIASVLVVASRAFLLWLRHSLGGRPRSDARRVLVVGAGDAGVLALRLLTRSSEGRYRPVGFLDDDPGKRYRRVGGVPIVGALGDISGALDRTGADLVILTIGEVGSVDAVRRTCADRGVECRDFLVPV
jgi:UDP-GlcNAc:undecaprenyl-phosphate/decaprenyl-phosphate GlcNAc-1-phosphate transferase